MSARRIVSAPDVPHLVERISQRRHAAEDPDRDWLPDDGYSLLQYLRSHRRVGAALLVEEDIDSLGLIEGIRDDLERMELAILNRNRAKDNVTARRLGEPLGLRTRQAVRDRRNRLTAKLKGLELASTPPAQSGKPVPTDPADAWLHTRRDDIHAIRAALVTHRGLFDDDEDAQENLHEIDRDQRDESYGRNAYAFLDLTVDSVVQADQYQELPDEHPVRTAVWRFQQLAHDYRVDRVGRPAVSPTA